MDLLPKEHEVTFLGWFHSVPEVDILSSWQSQHAEISIRTSASQTRASCRESNTVGKLPVSTDFLEPWWNPPWLITFVFCTPTRPAPLEQCQLLLPSQHVAWPLKPFLNWVVCIAKYGKYFLHGLFPTKALWKHYVPFFLKDSLLNLFATLQLKTLMVGSWPQASFPITSMQNERCLMGPISLYSHLVYITVFTF